MLDNLRAVLEDEELPHRTVLNFETWEWASSQECAVDLRFGEVLYDYRDYG